MDALSGATEAALHAWVHARHSAYALPVYTKEYPTMPSSKSLTDNGINLGQRCRMLVTGQSPAVVRPRRRIRPPVL